MLNAGSFTITNNNKYIILSETGDDSQIQFYAIETSQCIYSLKKFSEMSVTSLKTTNDDKYLLTGSIDGSIKIFDIETRQEVHHFQKALEGLVLSITFSRDDKYILASSYHTVKIYDLQARRELKEFKCPEGLEVSTIFSRDNKFIITSSNTSVNLTPTFISELNYVSSNTPLSSLFAGTYDNFLVSFWPKDVETQKRMLLCYQDMYVSPYNWTALHLLTIFNPSAIAQIPTYNKFKIPFLLDAYGKTPLHYLLAQNNRDYAIINKLLKYMLDYLSDKKGITPYEYQMICSSFSSFFLFCISKASPILTYRLLNLCYPETSSQCNEVIPTFGTSEQKYTSSQIPVMHPEVLVKLHEEGENQIVFRTHLIPLDYDPRSDDMFNTSQVLSEIQQQAIFKLSITENLIDHLWNTTSTTMYTVALAFSALMTLLSFYIALDQKQLYVEVLIILLTTIFIMFEFIQARSVGMEYLKSFWNYIDITQLLLTLLFILTKMINNEEVMGESWLVTFVIILGYLRWLSYLRLFTPTRILIEIILVVLYDMLGFITVIGSILIGFSLIFLEFDRYQAVPEDYGFHFNNTFKLLFGNYDDTNYTLSQKILVSLLLCILNVVLLNLLISIIGNSYGKVQDERDLIDAKIRVDMVQEAMILMRKFSPKNTTEKKYLIYKLPAVVEEENLENKEWEERIEKIEKALIENKREVKRKIKKGMQNVCREVQNIIKSEIKENANQVNQIKTIMAVQGMQVKHIFEQQAKIINEEQTIKIQNIEGQVNQLKDEVQGLKQIVNAVYEAIKDKK